MKVWLVRFPDDTMMVDGSITKEEAIDTITVTLGEFVKANVVKEDWIPKDAPKAQFSADVPQQAEGTG